MAYSYYRDRDEFIGRMSREGFSVDCIRALLRLGTTIQRLAVAQCNGDWPADNGQRSVDECKTCNRHWAPESLKAHKALGPGRHCEDCRAETRLPALLERTGWVAKTGGDPRGCTLKLYRANSTTEDRESGRAEYVVRTGTGEVTRMKAKSRDAASQIRIIRRVDPDDTSVTYTVELGFYIHRGTRYVWYREDRGWIASFNNRLQAEQAAAAPTLIARRDDLRRRRNDAPWTGK